MLYLVAAGGSQKHNADSGKMQGRRPRPVRREIEAPRLTYLASLRLTSEAMQRAEERVATGEQACSSPAVAILQGSFSETLGTHQQSVVYACTLPLKARHCINVVPDLSSEHVAAIVSIDNNFCQH